MFIFRNQLRFWMYQKLKKITQEVSIQHHIAAYKLHTVYFATYLIWRPNGRERVKPTLYFELLTICSSLYRRNQTRRVGGYSGCSRTVTKWCSKPAWSNGHTNTTANNWLCSATADVEREATTVSSLVFWAQSTTRDYIRAEGDFHK